MKFEITKMELQENKFGKFDILVSMVKVLDDNGKYIKFAKLNKELIEAMKEAGAVTIKK
jgi:hypothetical protein